MFLHSFSVRLVTVICSFCRHRKTLTDLPRKIDYHSRIIGGASTDRIIRHSAAEKERQKHRAESAGGGGRP